MFNLDFTFDKYRSFLNGINKYKVITISDFFKKNDLKNILILRHDVDLDIKYALEMANIEKQYEIKSTYYIRFVKNVFIPEAIKTIQNYGHEIGYHYETLARSNGDYEKAIKLFKIELDRLRNIVPVSTISMHGSPLSKYNNSNIINKINLVDYDLLGDAQLSINNIPYFTDTGGKWNSESNIRDFITQNNINNVSVNRTDELIEILKNKLFSNIYINCHPERWAFNSLDRLKIFTRDNIYNIGKFFIKKVKL